MSQLDAAKCSLEASLQKCQEDISSLQADLESAARDKHTTETQLKQQMLDANKQLLGELWQLEVALKLSSNTFCTLQIILYMLNDTELEIVHLAKK